MLLAPLVGAFFAIAAAAFKVEPVGVRDDGVVVGGAEGVEEMVQRAVVSPAYFVEFHNNYTHARFYHDLKANNVSYEVEAVFRDARIFYGVALETEANATTIAELEGVEKVWAARDTQDGKTVGFDGWLGYFGRRVT